ncbi:hypothetical protein Plhal703r1_c01g0003661 [Plasmopara halstedii]
MTGRFSHFGDDIFADLLTSSDPSAAAKSLRQRNRDVLCILLRQHRRRIYHNDVDTGDNNDEDRHS